MATITDLSPSYAKAGESSLTITGTGFVDAPSKTKVYHRKHGATPWEAVSSCTTPGYTRNASTD